jgi:hypothetical protein
MIGFPRQSNGIDCGMFVTQYMRHLALGMELNFEQSQMTQIRLKMRKELTPYVAKEGEDVDALNEQTYNGPFMQLVQSVKSQRMSCPLLWYGY